MSPRFGLLFGTCRHPTTVAVQAVASEAKLHCMAQACGCENRVSSITPGVPEVDQFVLSGFGARTMQCRPGACSKKKNWAQREVISELARNEMCSNAA